MRHSLTRTSNGRVLYLDMNAFFASVEQQRSPALRGQPVAVVSHLLERGTVLAASYEAKRLGVSTGTRLGPARQLCPNLAAVEPDPPLYSSFHRRLVYLLTRLAGPELSVRSVDEAAIYLSPNQQGSEPARQLALRIKEGLRRELGSCLTCSIGIAPNSFLAKVASNLQKPDGLTEINLENTSSTLAGLDLTDLPGIALANASHLLRAGIANPLELYQASAERLRGRFGIWGQLWWWRLHGYEADGAAPVNRSISRQHVLKHWLRTKAEVLPVVYRLADQLIHRLRRNRWHCQEVWIYLHLNTALPFTAKRRLDAPADSYPFLLRAISELMQDFPAQPAGAVRVVALGFLELSDESRGLQLDLFQTASKEASLSQAIESIRSRFGLAAVVPGSVLGLEATAGKEQVGFGRVKDRAAHSSLSG